MIRIVLTTVAIALGMAVSFGKAGDSDCLAQPKILGASTLSSIPQTTGGHREML